MRVLFVSRLMSGFADSLRTGVWQPTGAPAIAKLTSELPELSNHWPEGLLGQWRRWFLLLKINAALGPIAILLGLNLVKV